MDILILAFLFFIAYMLFEIFSTQRELSKKNSKRGKSVIEKKPAFSEEDWDEAVADWIEAATINDIKLGIYGKPGYRIWMPPSYDEVKFDESFLRKLKIMSGKNK